jgi:hypothetical protein
VQALGVDPYTFAKVAWTRPGLLSPGLDAQMSKLVTAEYGGTLLPVSATAISIWVHGEQTGGSLTASLTDFDLMPVTADFGALDFSGWRQRTATFEPSQFKAPLRLRHLTLAPVTKAGTVAVSDLAAVERGGASVAIRGFDTEELRGSNEWWVSDGTSGAMLGTLRADDRFPRGRAMTSHVFLSPGWLPVTLNPPVYELVLRGNYEQLITVRVPALVSSGLLAKHQVRIGDSLSVQIDSTPVNAQIVGTFDYFPTLYGDGLVFSLPLLLQVLGGDGHPRPWPSELWVKNTSQQLQVDEPTLMANPNIADVVSRNDLERMIAADPLGPAGRANLMLGFVAACALAVTAFMVHFAFLARLRTSEYAILQANGLSATQVARSLRIEQLLIVAFSTLLGVALGTLLSLFLVPGLQVSSSPEDAIPPTLLAVDAGFAIAGVGITVVGCILAGRLVARSSRVADVMPELRSLG